MLIKYAFKPSPAVYDNDFLFIIQNVPVKGFFWVGWWVVPPVLFVCVYKRVYTRVVKFIYYNDMPIHVQLEYINM